MLKCRIYITQSTQKQKNMCTTYVRTVYYSVNAKKTLMRCNVYVSSYYYKKNALSIIPGATSDLISWSNEETEASQHMTHWGGKSSQHAITSSDSADLTVCTTLTPTRMARLADSGTVYNDGWMDEWLYGCMNVYYMCMYVCMNRRTNEQMNMSAWMFACIWICMYVSMYIFIYVSSMYVSTM